MLMNHLEAAVPKPFEREPRYIVFKIKDLNNYCNTDAMVALRRIGDRIGEGRRDHGKPPFNAVVVEQDWPEFEPTWQAIEHRMTGNPIEPRHAIALRVKDLENTVVEQGAILEAITGALRGEEPSDFMLSFPDVAQAWMVYRLAYPQA